MAKDWERQSFQQSIAHLLAAMQYHTEEDVGKAVLQLLREGERCDNLEDFVRGINMRLLLDLQKGVGGAVNSTKRRLDDAIRLHKEHLKERGHRGRELCECRDWPGGGHKLCEVINQIHDLIEEVEGKPVELTAQTSATKVELDYDEECRKLAEEKEAQAKAHQAWLAQENLKDVQRHLNNIKTTPKQTTAYDDSIADAVVFLLQAKLPPKQVELPANGFVEVGPGDGVVSMGPDACRLVCRRCNAVLGVGPQYELASLGLAESHICKPKG